MYLFCPVGQFCPGHNMSTTLIQFFVFCAVLFFFSVFIIKNTLWFRKRLNKNVISKNSLKIKKYFKTFGLLHLFRYYAVAPHIIKKSKQLSKNTKL